MLSALIIDDEQLARDELDFLLKATGDVSVVAHGKNGLEAVQLIKEHSPDLVFIDVHMPGLDGFGVIKKLAGAKHPLPQFVFATAFDEYAVKAFEVSALDYILKPYDKKRIAQAVQKAKRLSEPVAGPIPTDVSSADKLEVLLKLLESQQNAAAAPKKILLRAAGRMILVDQKEVCFASIQEGVITVFTHTMEGESNCRTLEELLDLLDSQLFWRAHRGFLVNINRIREVVPWFKSSYQLRMDDKKQTEIPVSRAQTKRLRQLFNL